MASVIEFKTGRVLIPATPPVSVFMHCWACAHRVAGSSDAQVERLMEQHIRDAHLTQGAA